MCSSDLFPSHDVSQSRYNGSNLYKQIKRVFPELSLTASGGVSGINDIMELSSIGVDSVIIGRSFYEGAFKKGELESWLQKG